jgi:hypothetical protein
MGSTLTREVFDNRLETSFNPRLSHSTRSRRIPPKRQQCEANANRICPEFERQTQIYSNGKPSSPTRPLVWRATLAQGRDTCQAATDDQLMDLRGAIGNR